jgi:hypothetical protein
MGRPARSRGRRLCFAALLLALLAALLEGGARLSFRLLDGEPFSFERLATERRAQRDAKPLADSFRGAAALRTAEHPEVVHPYLGYALDLNQGKGGRDPSEPMRIEECAFEKPRRSPDTLWVGLFGGSVAYLFAADGRERLAAALRELPIARGRDVRFVVAAAGGWKQPQPLIALTWMLSLRAELDLIVAIDGFNEIALHANENAKLGTFPAYPRRWAARAERLPDPATRLTLGKLAVAGSERVAWADAMEGGATRWSAAANLLWRARDRQLERAQDEAVAQLRERPSTTASYLTQGPAYVAGEPAAVMDDLVATWESSSTLMRELCAAHSIRYFHFLQPNQYVDGSKPLTDEERAKAWRADHPYRASVQLGYPKLREAGARLAAAGESFHDLSLAFVDVAETLYTDDCCHFNRHGAEIVADRIAEVLRNEIK